MVWDEDREAESKTILRIKDPSEQEKATDKSATMFPKLDQRDARLLDFTLRVKQQDRPTAAKLEHFARSDRRPSMFGVFAAATTDMGAAADFSRSDGTDERGVSFPVLSRLFEGKVSMKAP